MANFIPLKNYILFCIDKLIETHHLDPPFLDVGCGRGDVSKYLLDKHHWHGKAIDVSLQAVQQAKSLLNQQDQVSISNGSIESEEKTYNTILFLDVIEHVENDIELLQKAYSLLNEKGNVIITVPSNPKEWRWDDEFYGHYRRYSAKDLETLLNRIGFKVQVIWDFTFPVFWLMRRLYTLIKRPPQESNCMYEKTKTSSLRNSWDMPIISKLLSHLRFFWAIVYRFQFHFFKKKHSWGHELIILAQK